MTDQEVADEIRALADKLRAAVADYEARPGCHVGVKFEATRFGERFTGTFSIGEVKFITSKEVAS